MIKVIGNSLCIFLCLLLCLSIFTKHQDFTYFQMTDYSMSALDKFNTISDGLTTVTGWVSDFLGLFSDDGYFNVTPFEVDLDIMSAYVTAHHCYTKSESDNYVLCRVYSCLVDSSSMGLICYTDLYKFMSHDGSIYYLSSFQINRKFDTRMWESDFKQILKDFNSTYDFDNGWRGNSDIHALTGYKGGI